MSTVSLDRGTAAIGDELMGDEIMGGEHDETISFDYPDIAGRYRATTGWGYFGARIYGKGYPWTPFTRSPTTGAGIASVVLTSTSGAILGRIRTDVQNSIFRSIVFTLDERGCADFELTLNALPDFPLLPMSIIRVNIANTDFNWYTGIVEKVPEEGTARSSYVYSGFGLRRQMQRVIGEGTYPAGTDVGLIVADIANDLIRPNTSIGYNTDKITTSTGVVTVQEQVIQQADLERLIDMYAKMASARWGVDGDGDFYFEQRSETVIKNWIVGYDFAQFEPVLNVEGIRNRIKVTRKIDPDESGWTIGAIANDESSQGKHGIIEETIQVLGVMSDDDCMVIAEAELLERAEPKDQAQGMRIPMRSGDDYIERGIHRVVNSPSRFSVDAQDCDDSDEWDISVGTGQDLDKETDEALHVSGSASLRLTWSDADGAYVFAPIEVIGAIKRITCWVYSSRRGKLAELGVGLGAFTQNLRDIACDVTDTWFLFDWDVSGLSLSALNQIGIRILNSDAASVLRIDEIRVEMVGSKHYYMEFSKAKFEFSPQRQEADVEWGPRVPLMDDYVSAALARSEENRILAERA